MPEWTVGSGEVCGLGESGSVCLPVEDWRTGGAEPRLPPGATTAVAGTVSGIGLPAGRSDAPPVLVDPDGRGSRRPLADGGLGTGTHLVSVDSEPEVRLTVEGPATVDTTTGDRRTWLRFDGPTPVTVGFLEALPERPTVHVPPTAGGLAMAVTAAGCTHRTDGPGRSRPAARPRTPRVAFVGDAADDPQPSVPAHLTPDEPRATMTVPDSATAVLVAAPLAYYLGAALVVDDGPPRLEAPGVDHAFDPPPDLAGQVGEALRALVHLDQELRADDATAGEESPANAGPDAGPGLASAPPADRLAAVLESPPSSLPTWPLTTYVDEDVRQGRFLPYVLDRLSLVVPARASPLDPRALLQRSLEEFYRGDPPTVETVDPVLGDSRFHAWLADGTPVDAYTLVGDPVGQEAPLAEGGPADGSGRRGPGGESGGNGESGGSEGAGGNEEPPSTGETAAPVSAGAGGAVPNRDRAGPGPGGREHRGAPGTDQASEDGVNGVDGPGVDGSGVRVDLVCNEPEMAAERDVASVYRDRLGLEDVEVVVHERLSRAELAAVFRRSTDLVHFVGHCEVDGLRCVDGTLAAADLGTCRARSFFLNACGSYHEGYDLVRRGATVGAVTLSTVLDEQAVGLGTTFAGLLADGFSFERAMSVARGEIIVGRDYAVVGDGTCRLRPPVGTPATCRLETVADGFWVRYDPLAPDAAGRRYRDPFTGEWRPVGTAATATLQRAALCSFLERHRLPVRFEGRLRWSDELAATLGDPERQN